MHRGVEGEGHKMERRYGGKGLRMNISITKVMVSGKHRGEGERTGKWPRAALGKSTSVKFRQ